MYILMSKTSIFFAINLLDGFLTLLVQFSDTFFIPSLKNSIQFASSGYNATTTGKWRHPAYGFTVYSIHIPNTKVMKLL